MAASLTSTGYEPKSALLGEIRIAQAQLQNIKIAKATSSQTGKFRLDVTKAFEELKSMHLLLIKLWRPVNLAHLNEYLTLLENEGIDMTPFNELSNLAQQAQSLNKQQTTVMPGTPSLSSIRANLAPSQRANNATSLLQVSQQLLEFSIAEGFAPSLYSNHDPSGQLGANCRPIEQSSNQKELEKQLSEQIFWIYINPSTGEARPETPLESIVRNGLYSKMCASLEDDPILKLLIPEQKDYNVASLLESVTISAQGTGLSVLSAITDELHDSKVTTMNKKPEQSMEAWLKSLNQLFTKYANHGNQLDDSQKLLVVKKRLESDERYANQVHAWEKGEGPYFAREGKTYTTLIKMLRLQADSCNNLYTSHTVDVPKDFEAIGHNASGQSKGEHNDDPRQRQNCFAWLKGNCSRRNCPYLHDEHVKGMKNNRQNASSHNKGSTGSLVTERCRNFFNTGKCAYGEKCRFSHAPSPSVQQE